MQDCPKFQLTIDSTGGVELVISTDNERELEELLNTWENIIIPDYSDIERKVVPFQINGDHKRYYPADNCPKCNGKLRRRRGRNGVFLGCKNYNDCQFSQSL